MLFFLLFYMPVLQGNILPLPDNIPERLKHLKYYINKYFCNKLIVQSL